MSGETVTGHTIGLLQFTIYSPERLGKGFSLPFAQNLMENYERRIFVRGDYRVQLDKLKAFELQNPHNRNFVTIIDSTFDYFHPDEMPVVTRQSLFFQTALNTQT